MWWTNTLRTSAEDLGTLAENELPTHYYECPTLYNILISFWRHATILPQRIHFYTTYSLESSHKAFNTELWYWASLMLLLMPIRSIAKFPRILEIFVTARSLLPEPMRIRQRVLLYTYLVSRTKKFPLPKPKARYPYLPKARSNSA